MIDSWGKLPEGILAGHTNSYGDFDECVQINAKNIEFNGDVVANSRDFDGLYCTTYMLPYDVVMSIATESPTKTLPVLSLDRGYNNSNIQEAVSLEEFLVRLVEQKFFNKMIYYE